jgi:hypothetical protein
MTASKLNRHPFDAILERHCKEMSELARGENNLELAEAYQKLQERFSKKDYKAPSQDHRLDSEPKSGRTLPYNF